ncbi:hypothetical protein HRbin04_01117 [archaeon HR04]|nr:hypothetical protein HRbin04_01117 [archaeon HR04]
MMMHIDHTFILMVIAVSSSGVLTPGPLFIVNIHYAKRYGHLSGLLCASGHAVVELPLIIAIALGMFSIEYMDRLGWLIGIVGGVALITFATMQLYIINTAKDDASKHSSKKVYGHISRVSSPYGPFLAGIAFSALNPFFIAWWLTVGMKIVIDAYSIASMQGILIMFIAHIWMDYAWLAGTAYMTRRGIDRIFKSEHGSRKIFYRLLYLALYAMLVYIGIGFIASSLANEL